MTVTVEQLREYVGTNEVSDFIDSCVSRALLLVDEYLGTGHTCPVEIQDGATLQVASELFHRRSSPQGISQFATLDGTTPMRVAKDALSSVYPELQRFKAGGGFAV